MKNKYRVCSYYGYSDSGHTLHVCREEGGGLGDACVKGGRGTGGGGMGGGDIFNNSQRNSSIWKKQHCRLPASWGPNCKGLLIPLNTMEYCDGPRGFRRHTWNASPSAAIHLVFLDLPLLPSYTHIAHNQIIWLVVDNERAFHQELSYNYHIYYIYMN